MDELIKMSVPHDIETMKFDVHSLKTDNIILKERLKSLCEDISELKMQNKKLIEFMYKFQGGSAWLFGLVAAAGALGGIATSMFSHLFPRAG